MLRFTTCLSGASLLALSACADLGYGEYSLDSLLDGSPGPVQLAELQGAPGGVITDIPGFEPPVPVIAQLPDNGIPTTGVQTVALAQPRSSVISRSGPSDAKPGQCYAEFITPAVTKTDVRQVLVSPASTKTETIPAKYKTETIRELVTPATTRTEVVPATYRTEIQRVPVDGSAAAAAPAAAATETTTERVLVKPAETRIVEVPAVYETVTERVKVADSYTEWRESPKVYAIGAEALGGTILANRVSSAKIMCLVEIPAEYRTVTKRVLVSEATTREETVPAEYEEVTREAAAPATTETPGVEYREVEVKVIDKPEEVRVVPVPATYKTVTKRVLESPAVTRTVPVPAVYREEASTSITTPAQREWVSVICDKQATPDFVMAMQRALNGKSLYNGPIDGIVGTRTRRAIRAFQGGKSELLSLASAQALGLTP